MKLLGRVSFGVLALQTLLILGCIRALPSHAAEYRVAPTPGWVVPIKTDPASRPAEASAGGELVLLSDVQTRIEPAGKTVYQHVASKALDSRGVGLAADISFVFDPSYEKVVIHALSVIRNGRVIDKLASAQIRVLQRESELEYRIYDGSKTVSVVLGDVRVGDIVEYAYSRSGVNPVFRNQLAGTSALQWRVPVAHSFVRLMVPERRAIAVTVHNSALKAEVSEADGYRDYRWEQRDIAGLKVDADAPSGYDPYAVMRWTEFPGWQAVADWGLPLYQVPAQHGKMLARAIDAIAAESDSAEARLLAVLRLVQRDIRYLGVEVGPGSHAPSTPQQVFERRFGDCKDKALLTVAMLRALGIAADTALVNTTLNASVANLPPSPLAFNHALVRATIEGRNYWLDPTRAPQSGDLAHIVQANFGLALVLEPRASGLVSMAPAGGAAAAQARTVRAVYDAAGGVKEPVRYTIKTTLRGEDAESLRASLARQGRDELQADYLNFYMRRYPGIKLAADMDVIDNPLKNTITTTEFYTISGFWQRSEKTGKQVAYVRSAELRSRLRQPAVLKRTAPLAVAFPEEIEEVTVVRLGGKWRVMPSNTRVRDAAFDFQHKTEAGNGGDTYVLTDRYRALAAEVKPMAMAAHAASLAKAYDEVGLTLRLGDDGAPSRPALSTSINWAAGLAGLAVAWAFFAWRSRKSVPEHRAANNALVSYFFPTCIVILVLAHSLSNGWKLHVLSLIAALIGSVCMLSVAENAPESHWLKAIDNPDALERMNNAERWLIQGFSMLPHLISWIGGLYLLLQLVS